MVQAKQSFWRELFEKKGQTKSYFFIVISCITWVSGYVYGNEHKFSPIQTNLSRSIVMTIGTYIICRVMNLNIEFRSSKSWRTLLKRHAAFILQGFVLAGMQFVMPLGVVHTIGSAGPIVVLIMQRIIRKDHSSEITGNKLLGCIIAVVGIVLTSNGKFIYSLLDPNFEFKSDFGNYVDSDEFVIISATVVLFLSMMFWAYGVLITQEAQCHSFQIVFHFAVTNLLFSSLAYILLPEKRPASQMYESLIWIGVFLLIAEICFTLGLNLAENIAMTNITSFNVVIMAYAIGIFRYGENVDAISLIGTALVLGGVGTVILTKQIVESPEEAIQTQLNQVLKKQKQTQKI